MKHYKYLYRLIICSILFMHQISYGATEYSLNPKGVVNILTRHNYLSSPEISSLIQNRCGVKISFDEYYSSRECYKRLTIIQGFHNYDIIIFPNEIFEIIKSSIKLNKSNLSDSAKGYNKDIKKHYLENNYPSNIAYFSLSTPGFIWNPNTIKIDSTDSIDKMFEKAKNNNVVLINNYVGLWQLIKPLKNSLRPSILEQFKEITKDRKTYITNGYNKIYDKEDFAFQHSGDAVAIIKKSKNKHLKFLVHPQYSFMSIDLLAALNSRQETQCVAKVLSGKDALEIAQKNTYFLSPYNDSISNSDPTFKEVYKNKHKIPWLTSFLKNDTKWFFDILSVWGELHSLSNIKNKFILSNPS